MVLLQATMEYWLSTAPEHLYVFPMFQSPEARETQTMCELVAGALHCVAHLQHALSDLMVDVCAPPPRVLRAPPTPFHSPFGPAPRFAPPVSARVSTTHRLFSVHIT
jgi:hypothetical protein